MQLSTENAEKIVLASYALHNFLREKTAALYTPPGSLDSEHLYLGTIQDGSWREDDCVRGV